MIDWPRLRGDRRALALIFGIPAVAAVLVGWVALADPFATQASPSAVAEASPSPSPTATPTPSPTATPQPTPTPTPQPAGLRDGRFTVLLLGSDDSAGRRNRRPTGDYLTDAITVLSVTENGRRLALISLPRDAVDLRLPDGSVWTGKINSLSYYRGPATVRDTMEILLGIPIDNYVQLDMDDFRTIVGDLHGVRVRVPYTLHDPRCTIEAGRRELNAERALCFARHRYSDSDYARAGRHQQLLLALRDRMIRSDVDYTALVRSLGTLQTDLRLADIPAYADLVRRSRRADVTRLVLAPPAYTTFAGVAGPRGWIQIPNVPAIQQAVAAALGP